jgi:hypothetical protein
MSVGITLFLVGVMAFADMDKSRFNLAFNMHMGIAAYGAINSGKLDEVDPSEDENKDGFIFMTDGDARTIMDYYIVNVKTRQLIVLMLSNDTSFLERVERKNLKVYKLEYSNMKSEFLQEVEKAKKSIGLR